MAQDKVDVLKKRRKTGFVSSTLLINISENCLVIIIIKYFKAVQVNSVAIYIFDKLVFRQSLNWEISKTRVHDFSDMNTVKYYTIKKKIKISMI